MIIISSIAGYNPEQGLTMYGVTKTALFGLTKVYAHLFSCHFSLCLLYLIDVKTILLSFICIESSNISSLIIVFCNLLCKIHV